MEGIIMSNYIELINKIVFHPGYYVKEYIEMNGLTLEDFANRIGVTNEFICLLINEKKYIN